ncbi:MAG TPA: hypothetical protein DGG94_10030 [Micromonosporaceae bacterium]|nr:hypothetical protein [Micromonosporaceae bacterium]HCU50121.1 hypothetical protein [Micromonosporaceae bacterium]
MPRASTIQSLADIAEGQWGLFTRRQAEGTGMAWTTLARLAKDGAAERVAHGVYRLRGNARDANLDVRVAWLQAGSSASRRAVLKGCTSRVSRLITCRRSLAGWRRPAGRLSPATARPVAANGIRKVRDSSVGVNWSLGLTRVLRPMCGFASCAMFSRRASHGI